MRRFSCFGLSLALVLGGSSHVWAQDPQPPPDEDGSPAEPPAAPPSDDVKAETPPAAPPPLEAPIDGDSAVDQPPPPPAAAPRPPRVPIRFPYIFNASTARLLPGAVIFTGGGVDTGGGLSSVLQVGLGDVAEFGVALTDLVRARRADGEAEAIFPYLTATFKMGVAESRLFKHQPALALGFRKSFEREEDGHSTRIAELYLVGSKDLGARTTLHLGGVMWDASITTGMTTYELNQEKGVGNQVRAFGGIEITPLPKAQIMAELLWMPEFNYAPTGTEKPIALNATLAWGVRYQFASWMVLEAGVRVPEIDDANLLDAQIFGQVKFVTRTMRRVVGLE